MLYLSLPNYPLLGCLVKSPLAFHPIHSLPPRIRALCLTPDFLIDATYFRPSNAASRGLWVCAAFGYAFLSCLAKTIKGQRNKLRKE